MVKAKVRYGGWTGFDRRHAMLVTHKHHHLDWGTYLIMTGLLGGLVIFAGILLKDCATMLTWTTGGG